METGNVEFSTLISDIQTDEARHGQQGEPTARLLIQHGKKAAIQRLIDALFWQGWRAPISNSIPLIRLMRKFEVITR